MKNKKAEKILRHMDSSEFREALEMAIMALDEQVPEVPYGKHWYLNGDGVCLDGDVFYCKNCDAELDEDYSFCPCCGQAIDWNSIEWREDDDDAD